MSSTNLQAAPARSLTWQLSGELQTAFGEAVAQWDNAGNTARLWQRDASLWTNADEAEWLGWLDLVATQLADLAKFKALAAEVHEDGFGHILLLATGDVSLGPEVFSKAWGRQTGWPELLVMDSTDPTQVRSVREQIDPARTLFCVASKAGASLEPDALLRYFYAEAENALQGDAGHHFVAITDAGSKLEQLANERNFRRVYYSANGGVGGYSALSDFGLVPHAAAGLDTEKLLKRASLMVEACRSTDALTNPGVALGLVLGTAAARFRRDKVTLICSESVRASGAWVAQLLAASTGKQGKGLIPVDCEPLAESGRYGSDRLFVQIRLADDGSDEQKERLLEFERIRQPVIRLQIEDPYDLGQLFFQWQIAAAVASSVLAVHPFDLPDVERTTADTRVLISTYQKTGSRPAQHPMLIQHDLQLFADGEQAEVLLKGTHTLGAVIRKHLDRLRVGDYFGLLAYLPLSGTFATLLEEMRRHVLEAKQVATVLSHGPRFWYGTGQLYQGGPDIGVFLQITCDEHLDVAVPNAEYTFGMVKAAQARADFAVLAQQQRPILRVHLGVDLERDMGRLRDLVCAAMAH